MSDNLGLGDLYLWVYNKLCVDGDDRLGLRTKQDKLL